MTQTNVYMLVALSIAILFAFAQSQEANQPQLTLWSQTHKIQYKSDVYLRCSEQKYKLTDQEKELNDDNEEKGDDDLDNDSLDNRIDPDDDNDGTEDKLDDDDDNDGIKDEVDPDDDNDDVLDKVDDDDDDDDENDEKEDEDPNATVDNKKLSNVTFYRVTNGTVSKIDFNMESSKFSFRRRSNLMILKDIRRGEMTSQYFCNSSANNTQVNFDLKIEPFLYVPEFNSYTVIEGDSIDLTCTLLYGYENGQVIRWFWLHNNQVLDNATLTYEIISNNVTHSSTLRLSNVSLSARGEIECQANNEYGDHSREVLLRVKSKLAPLWPALGIIAQLIVLVVIISCCRAPKRNHDKTL